MRAFIKSYQEEEIVAFSVDGKPITRCIYKEELAKAALEIKNENVISQQDLEMESENW